MREVFIRYFNISLKRPSVHALPNNFLYQLASHDLLMTSKDILSSIFKISFLFQAFKNNILAELGKFPEEDQDDVVILFTAHSLPMKVRNFYALSLVLPKKVRKFYALSTNEGKKLLCTLYQ